MLQLLLAPLLLLSQPDPSPPELLQDAELTAVTFVDADRGWAVGDRGAIWHTDDGGRNWRLVRSGTTCRLEAIQFVDGTSGIAVGGWTQPYTHTTHGVVLRTRDGGRTWQDTPGLALPGLKHVKMIDARQGWALGDASTLFPSGVFRTDDGGRTWSPVPKGETLGWTTGDFRDGRGGVVAGLSGALGVVTPGEIKPTRTDSLGPRYLQRLLLAGDAGGWLVGDGGLILTTGDGGYHWTPPEGPLPAVAADLDCRALAVRGSRVWIAGAPGTTVLHSPDNGRTWLSFPTGQTVPLVGLWFIDEHRGWAVGGLGTILHTTTGGQSWRVQRSGGTRAALLGIFGAPERVPLELVAAQGGSEGYLTAVEVLGRRDLEPLPRSEDLTASRRSHAAVVAAGGSGADTSWRFPLAERGLVQSTESILARWNQATGGRAAEQLEEHLVRRIRQWQPEVIVTEDVSPRGEDPLAHLTNQMTLAAVAKAADAAAYPEQIARTGLAAWKVKKVFAVLPADKPGAVNLTPAQWSQPLGCSLAEQAARGRSLIERDVIPSPRSVGLSLLVNQLPQSSGKGDVLGGINLQFGSDARRLQAKPPAGDVQALAQVAQKRRLVDQLLERIDSDQTLGAGWLAQISNLTQGLSSQQSGEIIWQMARKYHALGKSEQSAEALLHLLDKYPQHPLSDAAALWLTQYYASSEVAWRQRKETKYEVQVAATTADAAEPMPNGAAGAHVSRTGFSGLAGLGLNPKERAGRALALSQKIESTRPLVFADPALRFSLTTASRQAGQPRNADRFLQPLIGGRMPTRASDGTQTRSASEGATITRSVSEGLASHLWSQNATAEQWLLHPTQNSPKKICSVVTASGKPKLDGRLDDPLWKAAKAVSLTRPGDAPLAAAAVLAFDDEFLYVAVSCRKAPGVNYTVSEEAAAAGRKPDADLSPRDHVAIYLDIDRDYGSFWTLAFDDRGWPAESCFGDATWNPQWYLAAGGDEQFWTIEAAIPFSELSPKPPQVRDVWAVGIQRVIPRVGLQSFTSPAAIEPRPEAFGLLVFE